MEFIAHRVNTVEELKKLPKEYGVEIDLRPWRDHLILEHDPFKEGERFDEYLKHYEHQTMILNIKSERIEHRILDLIKKSNISKYFFLDSSFPMINTLASANEYNIALRFSEYEKSDTILSMPFPIQWVWVDCFSRLPINEENYWQLKDKGYKLCLVSPELQGRPEDIENYADYLKQRNISLDAICTKLHNIERWQKLLKL